MTSQSMDLLSKEPPESATHGHGSDERGYAHVASGPMLIGVFLSLVVLTVVTVGVTQYDVGPTWNLIVALVVATLKAGLVVAFFMHLVWDRRFHLLLLLSAVLVVMLFLGLSTNDRSEYQPSIDAFEQAKAASPGK